MGLMRWKHWANFSSCICRIGRLFWIQVHVVGVWPHFKTWLTLIPYRSNAKSAILECFGTTLWINTRRYKMGLTWSSIQMCLMVDFRQPQALTVWFYQHWHNFSPNNGAYANLSHRTRQVISCKTFRSHPFFCDEVDTHSYTYSKYTSLHRFCY